MGVGKVMRDGKLFYRYSCTNAVILPSSSRTSSCLCAIAAKASCHTRRDCGAKVVPIGVKKSDFQEFVDSRFICYEVLEPVDWIPMKAGRAVFINYEYLWSEAGCEHLWDYYKKVVME